MSVLVTVLSALVVIKDPDKSYGISYVYKLL